MTSAPLETVARIDRTVASTEECGRLPYVGLEHIEKDTGHFVPEFSALPEALLATKFRFTPKHVLYGKLRPYLNKVALPVFEGVCTTEILPILPDQRKLDRTYLWAVLLSPAFVAWASTNISGANLPRLDPKLLAQYWIPLPPLPEQKRIAAILERADRLRRLRRYALRLSDTYLQAVFLEMFGDPVRNPRGWPMSEMGRHIEGIRYGTGSPPEYTPNGIPFIRATNVKMGTVQREGLAFISADEARKIAKCRLRAGNLVLVRSGANTGDCALIPAEFDRAYAAYDLIIEVPYPYNVYFNFLINSRYGKAMIEPLSRRAGQPHLNAEQAKALRFPLPPTRLIERFAEVHASVEGLHAQLREAERQAEHLFQTLLQRAFRGQL